MSSFTAHLLQSPENVPRNFWAMGRLPSAILHGSTTSGVAMGMKGVVKEVL